MAQPQRVGLRTVLERGDREACIKALSRLSLLVLKEELRRVSPRRALMLCSLMDPGRLTELLDVLDYTERQRLLSSATTKELGNLLCELSEERAVALINELPARVSRQVMAVLPTKHRKALERSMIWPPDRVGFLMTAGWVTLSPHDRVCDALEKIREGAETRERVHRCFVVDDSNVFVGSVALEDIVLADPDESVMELLESNSYAINPDMLADEAARLISRCDRTTLPVVDQGRLVGFLTFDDVLDLIDQENTELFLHMAGVSAARDGEKPGVVRQVKRRFPCLLLCLMTGVLTTGLMSRFEDTLGTIVALAFFIPLLIDTGGNTGSQASALIIRAMALDRLPDKALFRVLLRELVTGLLLGGAMALLAAGRAWLLGTPPGLWLVVSLSMVAVVTASNLLGALLPFGLRRVGVDPALLSGPLLTTVVDVAGLAIYLTVAQLLLLR